MLDIDTKLVRNLDKGLNLGCISGILLVICIDAGEECPISAIAWVLQLKSLSHSTGDQLVNFLRFSIGIVLCCLPLRMNFAQQVDRSLCPSQPIRFAHYEMGALYTKGHGGIDEDVLQELKKRSHCDITVTVLPRARSWYDLEQGNLDMLASGVPTPEREKFAWFAPYLADKKYVILGPDVAHQITTMEQFIAAPKLMMGGVRSFKYSPLYDALVERLEVTGRLEQVGDLDTLYRMFAHGRFDATIASPLAYRYYFERYPPRGKVRYLDWDTNSKAVSALVLSKKAFSAKQARQWQALMKTMLSDGTILQILSRHLGPEEAKLLLYSN